MKRKPEKQKAKSFKKNEKICLFPDNSCESEAHTHHQKGVQS